jgi:CRISPR system Cascade subunit CasD
MATLLLRLSAPLQAWGVDAKFDRRGTERAPTKSGVIGLIAAALGRKRNGDIRDLQGLSFGLRIDREGALLRDYHTAKGSKASHSYVTQRYYLADAVFLVGLEGDDALLSEIEHALHWPAFPIYLGRRSCPPEGQISLGIRPNKSLMKALQEEPWLVSEWLKKKEAAQVWLRIIMDAEDDSKHTYFQRDAPVSFEQTHRKFGFRRIYEPKSLLIINPDSSKAVSQKSTDHDPILELGEG